MGGYGEEVAIGEEGGGDDLARGAVKGVDRRRGGAKILWKSNWGRKLWAAQSPNFDARTVKIRVKREGFFTRSHDKFEFCK